MILVVVDWSEERRRKRRRRRRRKKFLCVSFACVNSATNDTGKVEEEVKHAFLLFKSNLFLLLINHYMGLGFLPVCTLFFLLMFAAKYGINITTMLSEYQYPFSVVAVAVVVVAVFSS